MTSNPKAVAPALVALVVLATFLAPILVRTPAAQAATSPVLAGAASAAPAPQWAKDTPDAAHGLTVTTADFAGSTYGVSSTGLIRRYDRDGAVVASWPVASGAVEILSISVDRSLEVSVAGRVGAQPVVMGTGPQAQTVGGPFVARFRPDGALRWVRTLPGTIPFAVGAQSSTVIGDAGAVFVAGQFRDALTIDGSSPPGSLNVNGFALRLDADTGHARWLTGMALQDRPFNEGAIFVQSLRASTGHVVVGGTTGFTTVVGSGPAARTIPCAGTSGPGSCAYLADFDPETGVPLAAMRVATDGSVTQTAVADGFGYTLVAAYGSAITVGTSAEVALPKPATEFSGFVAHLTNTGAVTWLTQFTGAGREDPRSLDIDSHGNVIVSGGFSGTMTYGTAPSAPTSTAVGTYDLFLASFDPTGAPRWQTTAGGAGTDVSDPWQDSLRLDDDGAIHVGGSHTGPMTFGSGPSAITIQGTNAFVAVYHPDQPSAGVGFEPISPARVHDTRIRPAGSPRPLQAGEPITVDLSKLVPLTARAVTLNVTVTGSTQPTFITAYPAGAMPPTTSNLNAAAGETIANQVTVRLGGGAKVSFATAHGSADLVIDISGYFAPAVPPIGNTRVFHPVAPTRVLDSRTDTGGWNAPLGPGQSRTLQLGGVGTIPPTFSTVVLTLTATASTGASFLQVHPTPSAPPGVTNVIFGPGQTISNLVVTGVGSNGSITITNQQHDVHVVVDVVGYFDYQAAGGQRFHALNPTRVLDDRTGTGLSGPWGPSATRTLPLAGGSLIPTGAGTIIGNLTATNATAGSYLTTFAGGTPRPGTSTLAFGPSQTIPTSFVSRLGATGSVAIANHLGTVDVVLDVNGYFAAT